MEECGKKICIKCNDEKELNQFGKNRIYYRNKCKTCTYLGTKEHRQKNKKPKTIITVCKKCNSTREFNRNGKLRRCMVCAANYGKNYYKNNKEELSLKQKNYREENKESINEKQRLDRKQNPEKYKENGKKHYHNNKEKYKKIYELNKETLNKKNKKWRSNNKEHIQKYNKDYRTKNKETISKWEKEYYNENKEYINGRTNKKTKEKLKTDSFFRLKFYIKNAIRGSFKRKNHRKSNKTLNILGCSYEEFQKYIESKFESWMNWENQGKYNGTLNFGWDLDHIIPLDSAENEEDIIRLNHYTNFQPLCGYTNRHIKRNKI